MKFKEYEMPDGKKAVFEYDENGVGKVTLECMDMLMGLINDRKTENSSEKPNNCEDLQDWKDRMWAEAVKEEPQTCSFGLHMDCSLCWKESHCRAIKEAERSSE